jgi:hypothetical protein
MVVFGVFPYYCCRSALSSAEKEDSGNIITKGFE